MITISIDELHAHTGQWVRTAAAKREEIVVTDGETPVAVLRPHAATVADGNPFLQRRVLPDYAAWMNRPVGGTESTQIVSEDRELGADWSSDWPLTAAPAHFGLHVVTVGAPP